MALHITTKRDKAITEAIEARIAAGRMAADTPKPDHVARTPVPPFLADSALQPVQAVSGGLSDIHVVQWWLAHAHLIQQIIDELHPIHTCALPPAVRPVPETAPILNLVSKLRVQIPMVTIPSTRVNPAWVSAWSVAHKEVKNDVDAKRLHDFVMGGTPEQFAAWAFSRIEDAPKRVERVAA